MEAVQIHYNYYIICATHPDPLLVLQYARAVVRHIRRFMMT